MIQQLVIRTDTYRDLAKGDPVRVQGERGKFKFVCHCANLDTGSEWLDVFGGLPHCETMRAFGIERVTKIRSQR